MQSTARTASSVVNPAFAALGVTGLTAGAAVAGISAALNRLTGNLTGLGQLSRETGVAAKTLQEFGAVAGRFGIEQDAVASATKNFAAQMRTFAKGTGDAFNWVIHQGTNAAGRKAFQDFATDLQRTGDEGEKLKKALAFMETIRNPVERGIFAQQFFGNQDLARIADGHLGKVVDLFQKAREKIGTFNPDDILNAEKFDRSVSSLKSSMQRLGQTIAREVLGPATDLTTWADNLVSGQRADVTKSLREGLQGVKKELAEINWKQAGDDAAEFLKEGTRLAGSMAHAFHEIAEAIHAIRDGNVAGAVRGLDGASGPLARKLAPMPGDDLLDKQDRIAQIKRQLQNFEGLEGAGTATDRSRDQAAKLRQKLQEAEGDASRLSGRTPDQKQKDFEASEKLRKSVDSLTDEMKASRGGATVQKQSMDTQGGLFGGATIQSAAFGGGGGFRRPGGFGGGASLPGGGSGPGYGGEQRPAGGGRFNGLGGSKPSIAPIGPRPSVPSIGGGSPMPSAGDGSIVTHGHRWRTGPRTAEGKARVQSWLDFMQRPLEQGGLGADAGTARAMVGTMQGESSADLNPKSIGTVGEIGTAQWYKDRADALRRKAAGMGVPWYDVGAQQQHFRDEVTTGRYRGVWQKMLRTKSEDEKMWIAIDQFESPKYKKKAFDFRIPNLRQLQRDASRGQGPTAQRADGSPITPTLPERADGGGWAARESARKTFEAQQAEAEGLRAGGARVAASAARAGVVAMPSLEANGSVVVNVHKPGPETRVATTASGKLFQDVVQRSGAQMRRAD
ncbi:phage tail tip lysozyme [Methylobacterium sp. GC_Met_2]|uniref:phage tail tip lysozyme n=1 Tax=Methylobacterium sp. GC_Met_2 TaxID=2937376 RepID=UPI00226BB674|nr:phage tail tip lysozyme [Methylobacterium sp. GC_Met_2]